MRDSVLKTTIALGAMVMVFSAIPRKADAIPYFARKYHTTCLRCHTAVPKLNSFGKNFQLFGYQQPGDRDTNKMKISEDKNLSLLDQIPLAILVENEFDGDRFVNKNQTTTSFNTPTAFHIFGADSIAPDLGFFGEVATEDGVTDVGKVSLIAAFVGGTNTHFQVGKLDPVEHGVTEHDLFTRSGYSLLDMDLGGTDLGATERSGIRAYGTIGSTGTYALFHPKAAAATDKGDKEGEGEGHGPLVKLQKGQKAQKAQKAQKSEDQGDEDEGDPLNKLQGLLWEVGFYNSNPSAGTSTTRDAGDFSGRLNAYFNTDSFIGLEGFAGRTVVPDAVNIGSDVSNNYRAAGADASVGFGRMVEKTPGMKIHEFNLLASYLSGRADNPLGTGETVNFNGYFVELDKVIGGRAMGVVRYNKLNAGDMMLLPNNLGLHNNALTFNYTFYPRTNFWVGLEYTQDLNSGGNNHNLGLVFSFAF